MRKDVCKLSSFFCCSRCLQLICKCRCTGCNLKNVISISNSKQLLTVTLGKSSQNGKRKKLFKELKI